MNLQYLNPKYLTYKLHHLHIRRKFDVIMKGYAYSENSLFEGKNLLNSASVYNCHVGEGTYISGGSGFRDAQIGKYCSIGPNVRNGFSVHPSQIFVSTHPAFYSIKKQAGFTFVNQQRFNETVFIDEQYRIRIGNDVWIGNSVKLMDGIRIGDGAIIATGSVVTKDVEPYSIVGGVPAKFIRYRFTPEQINFLLDFKWWDKGSDWIEKNHEYFDNISQFMDRNS